MRPYRCLKCAESHPTKNCPKVGRTTPATCALCLGPHPSNYKGCEVYKEILVTKIQKRTTLRPQTNLNAITQLQDQTKNTTKTDTEKPKYYSDVVKGTPDKSFNLPSQQENYQQITYNRIEEIFIKQSEKIDMILQQMILQHDGSLDNSSQQTDKVRKLKIATWNINGLSPNKSEVDILLKIHDLDILLISETHFTNSNHVNISNYNIYTTNHPDGTAHGGTAVVIRSSIEHYELPQFKTEHIQATSVSVQDKNGNFNVSSVYCLQSIK
ncbi:unnamed protein product [Euphydryas editha]|uniref:Endonuclease/exonuclease/phosphatase domain-containing protein n=1 Tax=Euphydryas editha TaxID=104508 RepID=A0AAU9UDZ5_EUPED|nr:unnamed protein product [Euphydryas editha]